MKDAKPGQISSLAACLLIALTASVMAAELPNRKSVPFVIDLFKPSPEQPLQIAWLSPTDWFYTVTFSSGFGLVTDHGASTIKVVEQFDGSEPHPIPTFPPLSLAFP